MGSSHLPCDWPVGVSLQRLRALPELLELRQPTNGSNRDSRKLPCCLCLCLCFLRRANNERPNHHHHRHQRSPTPRNDGESLSLSGSVSFPACSTYSALCASYSKRTVFDARVDAFLSPLLSKEFSNPTLRHFYAWEVMRVSRC
jgi:hypothetical protein